MLKLCKLSVIIKYISELNFIHNESNNTCLNYAKFYINKTEFLDN